MALLILEWNNNGLSSFEDWNPLFIQQHQIQKAIAQRRGENGIVRTEVIQSNLSKANSWSYPERIEIASPIQGRREKGVCLSDRYGGMGEIRALDLR